MSSSQIPSPSRSQGATAKGTSPSRRKSRRTRSVSSGTSNISLRLTAVIPDSFPMSPLPTRWSVLNDDTDIQISGGQNWWKRLTVNSRRVTDVMGDRENDANAADEFDVETLSQEKENMSLNLPESSDGESIHSIVLPQRELLKNRDNRPKKKLKEIINRKETLGKMEKTFFDQTNVDKDIDVMPKKLFNRVPKPKTKSVFNAALFNASPNKTLNVNNSKEKPAQEVQGPVRNIFGYRPGIKRKNIYAEFVLSDSDDEFSEIQPRIFGFQTKKDHQEASKQRRLSSRSSVYSSASNITDVEMGEWNHLPSSTMVDHQFEEAGGTTPTKRIRLSRSRKSKDSLNKNNSLNTSRRSSQVRSNSKVRPEVEEMNINTRSQSFNKSKNNSQVKPKSINSFVETNKTNSVRESSQKKSSKFTHKVSMDETLTKEDMQVDLVNAEHENTLTEEYQHDQVDNDNFTLEFEDDEQIFDINMKNFEANQNISNKTDKHLQESNDPHIASAIIVSANVEIHSNQTDEIHRKKDISKSPEAVLHEKTNGKESYTAHVCNTTMSKDSHIASEVIENANIEIHSNQTDEIQRKKDISKSPEAVLHEKTNGKESYTAHVCNTTMSKDSHIASEIIENANVEIHSNQTDKIHRKKDISKSPEAVLNEKANGEESYTAHGHNTSMSKDSLIASEIIESANVEIHSNQTDKIHRKEDVSKFPEAVLNEKANGEESYTAHGHNTSMSKDSLIASEIIESANVEIHSKQTDETHRKKDITKSPVAVLNEKANGEESYTAHGHNINMSKDSLIASEIIESSNVEIHSKQTDETHRKKDISKSPVAVLHEKTNREQSNTAHGQNTSMSKDSRIAPEIIVSANVEIHSKQTDEMYKMKDILKSPEAVLHEKTNGEESYTAHGRNTSMSKSKTLPKDLNIRTSLAPARESSGFTDGTIGSSSECSVWDSHRTTRQTLRQTFGKDFTPRKSLRTLVMERAAKRQTNYNQNQDQVADKSGFQADADQSKHTITSYSKVANKSKDKSTLRTSSNKNGSLNQSKRQTDFDENPTRSNQEIDKNEKVECNEENKQSEEPETEQNLDVKFGGELKQNEEFESDPKTVENIKSVSAIDLQPNEESVLIQNESVESDKESKQNEEPESDEDIELYEKSESEKDVSQNEGIESDAESESFNDQEQNVESELEQNEEDEPDAESDQNEESESCDEQERNIESDLEQNEEVLSGSVKDVDQIGESESYKEQEQNVESEFEENEEVESEENEESESSNEQEQSEEFESYREPASLEVEKMAEKADHEVARRLRQANLEKYLQKVKEENAELRRKVQEKVLNSLKVPPKPYSVFKVPEIPKQRRATKIIKKAPKSKLKSTIFTNLDHLPAEFLEDLKYKPPKRFQGRNAPWITKRLYKFLEDKLQPKYDYRARVRAEKLVEKLYLFAKDARKCARAAPQEAVWELKLEMARLGVVATHHEFYRFFHEFMPREIRIRVNPDILNKIPLPRNVFGDIMEELQD